MLIFSRLTNRDVAPLNGSESWGVAKFLRAKMYACRARLLKREFFIKQSVFLIKKLGWAIGGKIEKKAMVTVGLDVLQKFSDIRADICFLGTGSIDLMDGITEGSYEVSQIKKTIIASSDRIVSLATSDKLGLRQIYSICRPAEIDFLVTELTPSSDILLPYTEAGIQLL